MENKLRNILFRHNYHDITNDEIEQMGGTVIHKEPDRNISNKQQRQLIDSQMITQPIRVHHQKKSSPIDNKLVNAINNAIDIDHAIDAIQQIYYKHEIPIGLIQYDRLDTAIWNISHNLGTLNKFKLSYTNDCFELEKRILQGITIAKALRTINGNIKEFLKQYHIVYEKKTFWDNTSWAIIYKEPYTYHILSGEEIAGPYGLCNTMHLGVVDTIVSQCRALLIIAKKEWPQQQYTKLYEKVKTLAMATS